ncbi:MAG: YkgJ family cysteine cluster protein [Phycisphaeraceae bacterium]|nr:YkgJ family cysteine cluster protein [Phycisphaeraceae bacterium]
MTATLSSSWSCWFAAVRLPAVHQAVRLVYDQLDIAIRTRGPVCWSSGKCCNFEAYGHRLYVTGLEIAWMLGEIPSRPRASVVAPRGGCPFQIEKLCSIHSSRPLGCRVFFCQQGTQSWQHEIYERFLSEIRVLHERLALPYQYMEWRLGLREAIEYLESSIAGPEPQ